MQNDAGEFVDLYVPRKCSASNRIIGAKDHASIQMNVAEVDKVTGRFNGQFKTYAICGAIRRMVSVWGLGPPGPLGAERCVSPFLIGRKDSWGLRDWVSGTAHSGGGREVAQRQDLGTLSQSLLWSLPGTPLSPSPSLQGLPCPVRHEAGRVPPPPPITAVWPGVGTAGDMPRVLFPRASQMTPSSDWPRPTASSQRTSDCRASQM
ncbi:ribosomal protein S21 [Phyllostomus discolor]|uniref:Small ribosomal subunit protein eS21 n=1 Tax=Phyllostomus discolor TaxID=89673 RepID=A0A834DQW9_9CHIR|nr:ribosomal protein S21 [Phyllostomus discolor]